MEQPEVRTAEPPQRLNAAPEAGVTAVSRPVTRTLARAARRRRRRSRLLTGTVQIVVVLVLLVAWQLLAGNPRQGAVLDKFYVGQPLGAAEFVIDGLRDGSLWQHIGATLYEMAIGFVIGCAAGVLVGLLFGMSDRLARFGRPFVSAANSVPRLALTPLFILWLGFGVSSKVALVVVVIFFLVFYNVYSGVRQVDPALISALRIMNASTWQVTRRVTLPSVGVWLISSLRVSIPYALVAAVVGEMVSSEQGLGYLLQKAGTSFNPSGLFGVIAVIVIISLIFQAVLNVVESRLLRWRAVEDGRDSVAAI